MPGGMRPAACTVRVGELINLALGDSDPSHPILPPFRARFRLFRRPGVRRSNREGCAGDRSVGRRSLEVNTMPSAPRGTGLPTIRIACSRPSGTCRSPSGIGLRAGPAVWIQRSGIIGPLRSEEGRRSSRMEHDREFRRRGLGVVPKALRPKMKGECLGAQVTGGSPQTPELQRGFASLSGGVWNFLDRLVTTEFESNAFGTVGIVGRGSVQWPEPRLQ
jgi:hypothetical protein